jgi:hypothetical protein
MFKKYVAIFDRTGPADQKVVILEKPPTMQEIFAQVKEIKRKAIAELAGLPGDQIRRPRRLPRGKRARRLARP